MYIYFFIRIHRYICIHIIIHTLYTPENENHICNGRKDQECQRLKNQVWAMVLIL